MQLKIGQYELSSNVLLAPMAGVSDAPFRHICRQLGAGLATSEMTMVKPNLLHTTKSRCRLNFANELTPISVQIAGSEPKELAYAAQYCVDLGAQIIDINMGCPAKKVCHKAAGSALMQDEVLVKEILSTVIMAVGNKIPVTLKTRTGWDRKHKNVGNIAYIAQEEGVAALSIHGRTRADKYQGEAEYDTIAKVVDKLDIPVIVNGDISSAKKARQVLEYTQAAGVMIGRAVQGNPWLISQIQSLLTNNKILADNSLAEKMQLILQHLLTTYDFYGQTLGVRLARKHIFWYVSHLGHYYHYNYREFWQKVNQITQANKQYQLTRDFLIQWTHQIP